MRGQAERGRRYYLVKWVGYDGELLEESTWEPAESLTDTASSAVDDFWDAKRTNIKVVLRYHKTRGLGGCKLSSQSLTCRAHWIAFLI